MTDSSADTLPSTSAVLRVATLGSGVLQRLLATYGLQVVPVEDGVPIPGSYWGEVEAGLIGHGLHVRSDTPVHSALHEAAHYICMSPARRQRLDRDAGGDDHEENAVCYLQILLADLLPGVGGERMCDDMDQWGYSFRLGSAHAWFAQDAEDARAWLIAHGIIDAAGSVSGHKRMDDRPHGARL